MANIYFYLDIAWLDSADEVINIYTASFNLTHVTQIKYLNFMTLFDIAVNLQIYPLQVISLS